ncbi:NADPH-adrenodoxin reductase [Irineochytrium annulatum]|nr:NADPH-adrenodoxin reductase [Irineochytrium annulatum]
MPGFYTASHLLRRATSTNVDLRIDLFDALPVPYGLIRYGIAPDHPEAKNVTHSFHKTALDPRLRFVGNVTLGSRSFPLRSLRAHYDQIVLSHGASSERALNIPGEDGLVAPAKSLVGWYNGQPGLDAPQYGSAPFDLTSVEDVAIVGQGNVALDLARMLLTDVDALRTTDTPEPVLASLAGSRVRRVALIGRRGPGQVSFTAKEVREMMHLGACAFECNGEDLKHESVTHGGLPRARKRVVDMIEQFGVKAPRKDTKENGRAWGLRFFESPKGVEMDREGRVTGLVVERNKLEEATPTAMDGAPPDPAAAGVTAGAEAPAREYKAVGTGELSIVRCQAVIRSVGYVGAPVAEGEPFDLRRGVVPNVVGRVTESDGDASLGRLYASGWVKRGPVGVVAATMYDAFETAEAMLEDMVEGRAGNHDRADGFEGVERLLKDGGVRWVSFDEWLRIDEAEVEAGKKLGKPREKITSIRGMLDVLDK